ERSRPAGHYRTHDVRTSLAEALLALGRKKEAAELAREAEAGLRAHFDPDDRRVRRAAEVLAAAMAPESAGLSSATSR
ncbi:MAG TPA: hypothetical protein VKU85_19705, partial [bacterium]|nr:hypothetical protein [bacterium]